MKKSSIMKLATICVLVLSLCLCQDTISQAAKKNSDKVSISLKNGTLTIKGKGAMPAKLKIKNKKKIKRVVIKKGVTSISNYAFQGCVKLKKVSIPSSVKKIGWYSFQGTGLTKVNIPKSVKRIGQEAFNKCENLKNITLPGNFKLVSMKGDEASYGLAWNTTLDTVTFNTDLKVKNASVFNTNNYQVSCNDKNFQSIEGIIYSKDGKTIVRVPFQRKELVIREGTETFSLQSILHMYPDYEGDPVYYIQLDKLVIPASVKTIEADQYFTKNIYESDVKNIEILSTQLDGSSLMNLSLHFSALDIKTLMTRMPEKISYQDGMYLTYDGLLLSYDGTAETVTLPDTVKSIGKYAFNNNTTLKSITLSKDVKVIPKGAFYGCSNLSTVVFPEGLTTIEEDAFSDCYSLANITLGNSVQTIGALAFCNTAWTTLTIPENVTTIGDYAFAQNISANSPEKTVTIQGSSNQISMNAFDCPGTTLHYTKSPEENRTALQIYKGKKLKAGMMKVSFRFNKIQEASGYQVVLSSDAKGKVNKKTITVKNKKASATVKMKNKNMKVYGKIRPYQIVDGKKVYGRWSELSEL